MEDPEGKGATWGALASVRGKPPGEHPLSRTSLGFLFLGRDRSLADSSRRVSGRWCV